MAISAKGERKSELKKKIILLLYAGLALGLSRSPSKSFDIIAGLVQEFSGVRNYNLKRTIGNLYESGALKEVKNSDGTVKIILSNKGKKMAEFFSLDGLKIKKPKSWDGNWRIVIFDVPERLKKVREAIRMHLQTLNFYELQKSVFVQPFPCTDEIDQIIRFYNARDYVRVISANSIDIDRKIMRHYGLN